MNTDNIITKVLDENCVANIERYAYEVEARKSVITEMLAQNMDVTTDAFSKYQSELVRYKSMFEAAKKEIEAQYVVPVAGWKSWTLDYASRTLTIVVAGEDRG